MSDMITLKDGTEVPADDFWLYAPTWLIQKFAEPVTHLKKPDPIADAKSLLKANGYKVTNPRRNKAVAASAESGDR